MLLLLLHHAVACQTDSVGSTLVTFSLVEKVCTFLLLLSELGWSKNNPAEFLENAQWPLQLTNPVVNPMAKRQERRGQGKQQDVGLIREEWTMLCPVRYRRNIYRARNVLKVHFVKWAMDYLIMNALVLYLRRHMSVLDLDPDDFFKGQGSLGEFLVPGIFPLQVSCPGTDTALFFIKSGLTLPQW